MAQTAHLSPGCPLISILSSSDTTLPAYPPIDRVNPWATEHRIGDVERLLWLRGILLFCSPSAYDPIQTYDVINSHRYHAPTRVKEKTVMAGWLLPEPPAQEYAPFLG